MPPALAMENNPNSIESLYERVVEYGKTSYELIKLKAVEKTSDFGSSFVPHSIVIYFIGTFVFFLSLGLAFWIGDLLGKISYGFFVTAGFYGVLGLVFHFFLQKPIKKNIGNFLIKRMLR